MTATGNHKLPFGNLPRLLLAWVSTEAVRTRSRVLVLGSSLSEFMRALGINSTSAAKRSRTWGTNPAPQPDGSGCSSCTVSLIYQDERGETAVNSSSRPTHRVLVERAQCPTSSRCGRARYELGGKTCGLDRFFLAPHALESALKSTSGLRDGVSVQPEDCYPHATRTDFPGPRQVLVLFQPLDSNAALTCVDNGATHTIGLTLLPTPG